MKQFHNLGARASHSLDEDQAHCFVRPDPSPVIVISSRHYSTNHIYRLTRKDSKPAHPHSLDHQRLSC